LTFSAVGKSILYRTFTSDTQSGFGVFNIEPAASSKRTISSSGSDRTISTTTSNRTIYS
jgi:hypothetical protein